MFKSFKEETGFALALVLLITTLVMVTVLEFNREMRVDVEIATNYRDSLKALYVAKGGINAAIFLLRKDIYDDSFNKGRTHFADSLSEDWAKAEFQWQEGEGKVTGIITDECGKVNLNEFIKEIPELDKNATAAEKQQEEQQEEQEKIVRRILEKLDIPDTNTDDIIGSLRDWMGISIDSEITDNYYNSLPSPYDNKASEYFDDITEMLLLKGIKKDLFYFYDYKTKEKSISEKEKIDNSEDKSSEGKNYREPHDLTDLFTVYSAPSKNKGKININTAPKEVLRALFPDEISDDIIDEIIKHQNEEEPFQSIDDLKELSTELKDTLNKEIWLVNSITFQSSYFRIIAHGTVNDVTRTIEAVVLRLPRQPDNNGGQITIKSWAEY